MDVKQDNGQREWVREKQTMRPHSSVQQSACKVECTVVVREGYVEV